MSRKNGSGAHGRGTQAALADALKKRAQNEKFLGKVPTIAVYADQWVNGLRLESSTIEGYKKIIRNHITPALGAIHIDKLTATRIAAHYRELEKSGRRDQCGYGKPPLGEHCAQGSRHTRSDPRRCTR